MKTHLLICLFILSQNLSFGQSWVRVADFPSTERDDGTHFIIGKKAYCGTGLKTGWIACNDMYAFDMSTETWSTSASLPPGIERQYASGFSYSDSGFIFGGYNTTFLNDLWMFNAQSGLWQQKASLPSDGRSGACSFVINNIVYIIGGKTATNSSIDEVWGYDILNDTWIQKNDLPFGSRWRASAAAHNGKGYLVFGKDENNSFRSELYEYDPALDLWSLISNFPGNARAYSALNAMGKSLIVVAGLDTFNTSFNDMWEFDLLLMQWKQRAPIPSIGRRGGMCFNSTTTLFYTTGIDQNNNRLKETWKVFNPTNIKDIDEAEVCKVFPNPSNGNMLLSYKLPGNANGNIEFFDVLGRKEKEYSLDPNSGTLLISEPGWLAGIYFYRIVSEASVLATGKVVITR